MEGSKRKKKEGERKDGSGRASLVVGDAKTLGRKGGVTVVGAESCVSMRLCAARGGSCSSVIFSERAQVCPSAAHRPSSERLSSVAYITRIYRSILRDDLFTAFSMFQAFCLHYFYLTPQGGNVSQKLGTC